MDWIYNDFIYNLLADHRGKKISGVVLCQQVKTIDFVERGLRFIEKAPDNVISEVSAKVKAIVA